LFLGSIYSGTFERLKRLFEEVKSNGYKIVGPKLDGPAIRLRELTSFEDIPYGYGDEQAPGYYRVIRDGGDFRNGPDSPKRYLYPPELLLFVVKPDWSIEHPAYEVCSLAFFGIKPCDLAAIKIMDQVQGTLGDKYYLKQREKTLIIVENCTNPGETCFCATMGTGPLASTGFDIAYTRIDKDTVLFQPGSDRGVELLSELDLEPATGEQIDRLKKILRKASEKARADFTLENLPEVLETAIESKIYEEVAERCLGCANCNMVCPTCNRRAGARWIC